MLSHRFEIQLDLSSDNIINVAKLLKKPEYILDEYAEVIIPALGNSD